MRRFLLAAAAGWTAVYGYLLWDIARQLRTHAFVPARGTITVSRPAAGDRAAVWEVEYEYPAGGATLRGTRVDADGRPVGGPRAEIDEWVKEFPPGSPVVVYHDPDDPADALLFPGLANDAPTVGWVLLLLQLPAVGVVGAVATWHARGFDPADPRHVRPTPTGAVARLPAADFGSWLWAAAVAWVVLSVACLVGVGRAAPGKLPAERDAITLGAWGAAALVVLGLTAAAAWLGLVRPTLTIDAARRTLTLDDHVPFGRRLVIPFAAVDEVATVPAAESEADGVPRGRCRVRLARTRAGADPLVLAEYPGWRDADALAAWVWSRIAGPGGPP